MVVDYIILRFLRAPNIGMIRILFLDKRNPFVVSLKQFNLSWFSGSDLSGDVVHMTVACCPTFWGTVRLTHLQRQTSLHVLSISAWKGGRVRV